MATKNKQELLERRLVLAFGISLLLNLGVLWGLAHTSANRPVTTKRSEVPLASIAVEKPLPRLRGLLPSPKGSPTPPPSAAQAQAAQAAGKLPTPVLPPPAYPGVQVFPSTTTASPVIPLPTPAPIQTPDPNAPKPVQVAVRPRGSSPDLRKSGALPAGFKPIVLPPPGSGVPLAGENTGFSDSPTPKPTPAPTATPAPTPRPTATPTPSPEASPTPEPKAPKGETRDPEPREKFPPEIPAGLKYKPQVKLSIDIDADGSAEYSIRVSSGNEEVDQYVLEALRKWKWTPALSNGKPIARSIPYTWDF